MVAEKANKPTKEVAEIIDSFFKELSQNLREKDVSIKEKTPTPFRNYRPSAKGLYLICLLYTSLSVVFQIVTLPFLRVLPSLADKKKPDNHTKHKKGTFLIT